MNIDVITSNGTPIELVRFFQLDDKQYLIFKEDNLTDEGGHLTIRISEIGNANRITANAISDDNWENVKNIIKNIVNLNKNNQPLNIKDLDYNSLEGVEISGYKSLKLMENYVNLLKLNQTVFEKKTGENIIREIPENSNNLNDIAINNVESLNNGLNVFNQNTFEQPTFEQPTLDSLSVPGPIENSGLEIGNNSTVLTENLQPEMINNNVEVNNVDNDLPQQVVSEKVETVDYQRLYVEQLEIVKQLQSEIQMYQSKLDTLKSIINN